MSGGALHTRTSVTLGQDGVSIVKTSNPHWIELGSLFNFDCYWEQESGSKVTFLLDQSGVTPIEVKEITASMRACSMVSLAMTMETPMTLAKYGSITRAL